MRLFAGACPHTCRRSTLPPPPFRCLRPQTKKAISPVRVVSCLPRASGRKCRGSHLSCGLPLEQAANRTSSTIGFPMVRSSSTLRSGACASGKKAVDFLVSVFVLPSVRLSSTVLQSPFDVSCGFALKASKRKKTKIQTPLLTLHPNWHGSWSARPIRQRSLYSVAWVFGHCLCNQINNPARRWMKS